MGKRIGKDNIHGVGDECEKWEAVMREDEWLGARPTFSLLSDARAGALPMANLRNQATRWQTANWRSLVLTMVKFLEIVP